MLITFFDNLDKQLILEFKNRFGKDHPVFPKNPLIVFFESLRNCKRCNNSTFRHRFGANYVSIVY